MPVPMNLQSLVSYLFPHQPGPVMSVEQVQVLEPDSTVVPATSATVAVKDKGLRKNGKHWHETKKPFRPTKGLTSYQKRIELEKAAKATKSREQELKDEKEEDRVRKVQAIKDRRKAKEEKERYEKMAEKMHAKRVERRKRREKRNKLLKS